MPTVASNVRKDLNEFQEKHATLVLTTVKVNSTIFLFVKCLGFFFLLIYLFFNFLYPFQVD